MISWPAAESVVGVVRHFSGVAGMSADVETVDIGQPEQAESAIAAGVLSTEQDEAAAAATEPSQPINSSQSLSATNVTPLTAKEAQAFFPPGPTPQPPHLSLPASALSFLASYPLRYPVISLMRQMGKPAA